MASDALDGLAQIAVALRQRDQAKGDAHADEMTGHVDQDQKLTPQSMKAAAAMMILTT
jgi:hypothetical protein